MVVVVGGGGGHVISASRLGFIGGELKAEAEIFGLFFSPAS